MKTTTIESLAQDANSIIDSAQREGIVVTRNGEPLALVVGIANRDEEDWDYMTSRAFWEMIRERRERPTVSLTDAKAELLGD